MIQTIAKIDGMMCSMCEAHIQDAIRKAIPVRSVKASHTKGEAVIVSDSPIGEDQLRAAIDPTGYTLGAVTAEPYERKGFSLFSRK